MSLPRTACQRALSMPEIVSEIIAWINEDKDFHIGILKEGAKTWEELRDEFFPEGIMSMKDLEVLPREETLYHSCGRQGVLFRCALVNKLWFSESVHFLWADLVCVPHSELLPHCFAGPAPARRQYYANFVRRASIRTFDVERDELYNDTTSVDGVVFQNLEWLLLRVPNAFGRISVTHLQCPNLKVLEIDPYFDHGPPSPVYGVMQEAWDYLFNQIAILWPSLETIKFIDYARVWPGALERYKRLMPCLERFDTTRVIEDSYVGLGGRIAGSHPGSA